MSPSPELSELLRQRANDRWIETERDLDEALAEIERLQRRCEVYASGMFAIAVPLDGTTKEGMVRIAQNTLDRLHRMEQEG